jgi:PhnB protein
MTVLNPYINFRGDARAAGDFYQSVFGGELTRSTFAEFQVPSAPEEQDWIMHSQLSTEGGLTLMVSDVPTGMQYSPGNNVSVSLSGESEAELRGYFDKLAEGGTVELPLEKAPWGDFFGQLSDRFGIHWLVNVTAG